MKKIVIDLLYGAILAFLYALLFWYVFKPALTSIFVIGLLLFALSLIAYFIVKKDSVRRVIRVVFLSGVWIAVGDLVFIGSLMAQR